MKHDGTLERLLATKAQAWGACYPSLASVIPPRSVVRVIRREPDWDAILQLGATFRIGYYSTQVGPGCVWLVDAEGTYFHTWDHDSLLETFELVERSNETDTFGHHRPEIEPIP